MLASSHLDPIKQTNALVLFFSELRISITFSVSARWDLIPDCARRFTLYLEESLYSLSILPGSQ